jgi:YhcH/YjgK/YiaL family protein
MILDHLTNEQAFAVLPDWPQIVTFLQDPDILTCEAGRYDLDGERLYAIVADDVHTNKANPLEAHRRYIDVQVAVRGSFVVQWKALQDCTSPLQAYDAEKDMLLMADEATTTLTLVPGIAAVFYPEDAHAPQPPAESVRKVVFKVAVGK